MGRRINLLSKRERKTLARNLWTTRARQVERAAEILEKVFNEFLTEMRSKSGSGDSSGLRGVGIGEWKLHVDREGGVTFQGRTIKTLTAFVDHPVFNILDEGREDKVMDAYDFGLKAWPIVTPRREDFGSTPMTSPDTLDLQQASSDQPVIFRRFFRGGIQARNYTQQLYKKAQEQIDKEGLNVILELKDF